MEIKSRKDMVRIIKEEWEKLGFEEVNTPLGRWPGISWLCRMSRDVFAEIVAQNGFVTNLLYKIELFVTLIFEHKDL